MARSSITGSSIPDTRTTKLPFPGFSLLISTVALVPTAFSILRARDLNAPHCLQASTVTTVLPTGALLVAPTFLAGFLAGFLALAAGLSLAAGILLSLRLVGRVALDFRAMVIRGGGGYEILTRQHYVHRE